MSSAFSAAQYDNAYPEGIEYHWWNRARAWHIAKLLRSEAQPGWKLLEIGCGRGLEVQAMRLAGFDAAGVELAAVTPVPAMEPFVRVNMDAAGLPEQERAEVDCLLLLDVIEHVPDPAQFLQTLVESFPQAKSIVVTVPAAQELWSNYDDYYGHQRRYSLEELRDLSAAIGWREARAGYSFRLLYIPARLLTLCGVNRATQLRAPRGVVRGLHAMISWYFRMESVLLPRRIRGSIAYAIFRRAQ